MDAIMIYTYTQTSNLQILNIEVFDNLTRVNINRCRKQGSTTKNYETNKNDGMMEIRGNDQGRKIREYPD